MIAGNLAAKRQQNLAQGVSPGFDFRADPSREGAADAANLPPLRGCDMDEHEPQRSRVGYLLTPLRGWGNTPVSAGLLAVLVVLGVERFVLFVLLIAAGSVCLFARLPEMGFLRCLAAHTP